MQARQHLNEEYMNWWIQCKENNIHEIKSRVCVHIALLCVQQDVAKRPSMATIVLLLSSNSITMSMPSKLIFFAQAEVEADKSSRLSLSKASITELIPR